MKYLSGILLAFIAFVLNIDAQQAQGSGSKVTAAKLLPAVFNGSCQRRALLPPEAVSESVQTLSDGNKILAQPHNAHVPRR
jgi:hypothetical protein